MTYLHRWLLACAAPLLPLLPGVARADDARAVLERAVAALPAGWTVHYADPQQTGDGALTIHKVTLSHDGKLLAVAEAVTFAGLRGEGTADAPFAADTVTATTIGESEGKDPTIADTLTATGVSVGPGAADGVPAGSHAATLLLALTAVHIDHAELRNLHAKDGHVGQVVLDHMADARVAAAKLADFASQSPGDKGPTHLAAIEANDVDLGRLIRVFDPSAYAAGAPRLPPGPAVGRFALHGLEQTEPNQTVKLDAVELTEMHLGQAPDAPEGAGYLRVPAMLGSGVVSGLSRHGGTDPDVDIGSIALGNYHDGQFDALRLAGLKVVQPNGQGAVSLKSAELHGFNGAGLMSYALGLNAGRAAAPKDQPGADQPGNDQAGNDQAGGDSAAAPDAPASPPPPRLAGFDLKELAVTSPQGDRVTVASVHLKMDYREGLPVQQAFAIRQVSVPSAALARAVGPEAAAAFGRDTIAADLDFNLQWNPDTHDFVVAPLQIAAADLGTLTVKLTLGNVDLSGLPQGGMMAAAGLIVATVKQGEVTYVDHSLVDRILAVYAAMQGQDPKALKAALVQQLEQMASPLPSRPKLPRILAGFLRAPGTLSVQAAPPTPIAAASLAAGTPDQIADRLGLAVAAR